MTTAQALVSVGAVALCTFLTRAIPFLLFPSGKPVPGYIAYLGDVLPFSVMGMLIVYCLKSVSLTAAPFGIPEGVSVAFVVLVHRWKHSLLLSILGGTVLYMLLVQAIFV